MELLNKKYGLNELPQIAKALIDLFDDFKVITFEGEMGAGKTTLISYICKELGVKELVSSPTFSIINEYQYIKDSKPTSIFHIDLYRLKGDEEAMDAGIEDCLYSGKLCFVEWPQRISAIMPDRLLTISLDYDGVDMRSIIVVSEKKY